MIVADESVDLAIVTELRRAGFEVPYIAEDAAGASDDVVLQHANGRGALLLTADKDFGELVFRLKRLHQGVVLCRLAGIPTANKARIVVGAFRLHQKEFTNSFSVISASTVRIRKALQFF